MQGKGESELHKILLIGNMKHFMISGTPEYFGNSLPKYVEGKIKMCGITNDAIEVIYDD